MHVVTSENYENAIAAVKDILMMYVDIAEESGFNNIPTINVTFDPLTFVDAKSDDKFNYVDMDLLRTGSAIALVSMLYDNWADGESHIASEAQILAVTAGRLSAFPDIETICRALVTRGGMSREDTWFVEAMKPIYRKYVLGFFKQLSRSDSKLPI